ncbi:putative transcriptional regulator [Methanomicrobium sp. W14]|uniref:winged helix-turn-helix transcriptional regulator n=1 Tax=Methanomicrobium sp. W14 TaxID=2817839 RepID=UPI001AEAE1AB|nr:winged helix-turn-helix transcriptional regulator [Methanomicrobium sp. W14]MBP2133796.1 putative transcriptional regulator [Methanomicrobium sp. W14]
MLQKLLNEIELVGRHLEVIRVVQKNQPIGIMKLSEILGIPSHRVRYSLKVLEQLGYIRASPSGAVATEKASDLIDNLDREIDSLISQLESIRNSSPD